MNHPNACPPARWLDAPVHLAWLQGEGFRLLDFARAARLPLGFGALDARGCLPKGTGADTLNTTRMTHAFALAHLHGVPGSLPLVEHGVAALLGVLQDVEHGGWYVREVADPAQGARTDTEKAAYLHTFVALAASSAVVAGAADAETLLTRAIDVLDMRFWREEEGALCEGYARNWQQAEAYRGANSNMHGCEAFLALADVTGDVRWLERALRIMQRLLQVHARGNGFAVIEHFDEGWQPLLNYNEARPADEFRPFGSTPGHAFEWARLALHLEASRALAGLTSPGWLLEVAQGLFDQACQHAWHADGASGLVYTLDWSQRPVVRERLHWVHAEATAAAAALLRRTGDPRYEAWYRRLWDFIAEHFIDRQHGSWHHELDADNRPAGRIWPGKPDLYHAYQAVLLPTLPLAPSLATALASLAPCRM